MNKAISALLSGIIIASCSSNAFAATNVRNIPGYSTVGTYN